MLEVRILAPSSSERELYLPVPRATQSGVPHPPWSEGSMSPRSSDGAKVDATPKGSFYEGDESPRSITAACSFDPTPLDLPPAFPEEEQEERGVNESGREEASDQEFEGRDRARWEERLTSNAAHVDFVAMCERKRRRSRELARELEQLSWAGRAHPLTQLLALSAALLLLAEVMPAVLLHPPSATPPIKPKAALLQPLMMHYEFDPDMFDNFWFPLFV